MFSLSTALACQIVLVASFIARAGGVYSTAAAQSLRAEKFNTSIYDRISRPNGTTTVKAAFNLLSITDLELTAQKFSCIGWITFAWTDERLLWSPSSYDNIEYMYALETEIWKPEVIVDNALSNIAVIHDKHLLPRIKYTGEVHWEPPLIFEVHCDVDITFYPFDKQNCAVQIVTWGMTKDEVVLRHLSAVNLEDYSEHGEWIVTGTDVTESELVEHLHDEVQRFCQLEFHVILQRRPIFYILNTILPVIVCSLLLVVVFLLPVHSGEKVVFPLTVFLALSVLLTITSDHMPSTSLTISVLGIYLAVTFLLAGLTILGAVFTINLHYRPHTINTESAFIKFTERVAKCMNFKRSKIIETEGKPAERRAVKTNAFVVGDGGVAETEEDDGMELTWPGVAEVWDRILLIVFVTLTVVSTVVFMIGLGVGGSNSHK